MGCVTHPLQEHPTGCPRTGGDECLASTVWPWALVEVTSAGCSSAASVSPTRGLQVTDRPAVFVSASPWCFCSFPSLPYPKEFCNTST